MTHLEQRASTEPLIRRFLSCGEHFGRIETGNLFPDQTSLLLECLPRLFSHDVQLANFISDANIVLMTCICELLRYAIVEYVDSLRCSLLTVELDEAETLTHAIPLLFWSRLRIFYFSKLRQSYVGNLSGSRENLGDIFELQTLGEILQVHGTIIHLCLIDPLDIERDAPFN